LKITIACAPDVLIIFTEELIFLKGDALPKSAREIKEMGYESPNVKYTGLGSGY